MASEEDSERMLAELEKRVARLQRIKELREESVRLRAELGLNTKSSMREIVEEIAGQYRITYDEVVGPSRQKCYIEARHHAFYVLWEKSRLNSGTRRWSSPQIGRHFGGRDHTTVFHGARRYAEKNGLGIGSAVKPWKPDGDT